MSEKLTVREIQQDVLLILECFDRFCQDNNLRYSLAYGTLIGAVRHKGFIPWDDDIDVLMPREDYEKMLQIGYDDGRFELKNYNLCNNYYYAFAKMYDKKTIVIDKSRVEKDLGLYIDIFPMDFFCGDVKQVRAYGRKGMKMQFLARSIGVKPFSYFRPRYIIRSLIGVALFPFRNRIFYKLNSLGCSEEDADYCAFVIHNDSFPEIFDSSIWNNLINMNFEGHSFPVFSDYDKFLTMVYGDYMTPPPKEYQVSVHGIEAYMKLQ